MAEVVSKKLNIPLCTVVLAYKSFWDNIKEQIESRVFDNIENQSDMSHLPVSFNIPSVGKLYADKTVIEKINKRKNKNENIEHTEGDANG